MNQDQCLGTMLSFDPKIYQFIYYLELGIEVIISQENSHVGGYIVISLLEDKTVLSVGVLHVGV